VLIATVMQGKSAFFLGNLEKSINSALFDLKNQSIPSPWPPARIINNISLCDGRHAPHQYSSDMHDFCAKLYWLQPSSISTSTNKSGYFHLNINVLPSWYFRICYR
jgi:hypothetical protein